MLTLRNVSRLEPGDQNHPFAKLSEQHEEHEGVNDWGNRLPLPGAKLLKSLTNRNYFFTSFMVDVG